MSGMVYEFEDRWRPRFSVDSVTYDRVRPGRLPDREALTAVLKNIMRICQGQTVTVSLNEQDFATTDVTALLEEAPPKIRSLHVQSDDGSIVLHMDNLWGGRTWVDMPMNRAMELQGLVATLHQHSKNLGWRRVFARSRRLNRLAPAVVDVVTRERRKDIRARRMASVIGLLGVLLGAGLSEAVRALLQNN